MRTRFIQIFGIIVLLCAVFACQQPKSTVPTAPQAISMTGADAVGAYLTSDHQGKPVLCWTEKGQADSLYRLKYAVYDSTTAAFGAAVTVAGSEGSSIAAESMGKVAFKSDGTVVAVFGKRFPREKSPYAGAIYYSYSRDAGKTWSRDTFVHSDTAHHYGRSFFDLSRLSGGEVAVVWLDGRFGKSIKGSALYFARTGPNAGFGMDQCLQKGTCECCRTDLVSGADGTIHVAYRSIMFPPALFGAQVRDMAYIRSTDQGGTFTSPKTISEDHWEIDGCPHSGPSLVLQDKQVNAAWFTAGGSPGLYFSRQTGDSGFRKRSLISAEGRHPQMAGLSNGKLALVYEEAGAIHEEQHSGAHSGAAKMHHASAPSIAAKIVMAVLKVGKTEKSVEVTDGRFLDHHAVVTSLQDGALVAWLRQEGGHSRVYYKVVDQ